MCAISPLFGSYIASCRPEVASGYSFADGRLEPSLQKSGFDAGRTVDVIHTRPFSSNIGLWTLLRLVQIGSSPQYGDGCGLVAGVRGVSGSRTVSFAVLSSLRSGSMSGSEAAVKWGQPGSQRVAVSGGG